MVQQHLKRLEACLSGYVGAMGAGGAYKRIWSNIRQLLRRATYSDNTPIAAVGLNLTSVDAFTVLHRWDLSRHARSQITWVVEFGTLSRSHVASLAPKILL
jgi:uncharacterized NAD(P)/FAD-binding protein YdhS